MKHCTLIGISDSHSQWFPPEVEACIRHGHVFSGGRRHREIVGPLLPDGSRWIEVSIPLSDALEEYAREEHVIVFCSGDPLFYGLGVTIQRKFPNCRLQSYPAFNSLQMLAHRLMIPYGDMRTVSLTGRDWHAFDQALIRGERLIGVLTDRTHTPHAIRQRMHEYGYDNYDIYVGECLGHQEKEYVAEYDARRDYQMPNCLLLRQTHTRYVPFGLPDEEFSLLDGRTRMITKMPVRLSDMAALGLNRCTSFWDIGFCTGSISIEARLAFPHLLITAFEQRDEGERLLRDNARRFGAPGIVPCMGDFLTFDLTSLPRPDAVFIGGHGGHLEEIIDRVLTVLLPGGCIVINSVTDDSSTRFISHCHRLGIHCELWHTLTVDNHHPIKILKATYNP